MNIFKKIAIFNKVTKIIKEVKKYFADTVLDEEICEIIKNLKNDFERLIQKAPELKEAYFFIFGLIKK